MPFKDWLHTHKQWDLPSFFNLPDYLRQVIIEEYFTELYGGDPNGNDTSD